MEGLNNNLHQRETINDKLTVFFFFFFCKTDKAMEVKRVSKTWVRISTTNIHLLQFKT